MGRDEGRLTRRLHHNHGHAYSTGAVLSCTALLQYTVHVAKWECSGCRRECAEQSGSTTFARSGRNRKRRDRTLCCSSMVQVGGRGRGSDRKLECRRRSHAATKPTARQIYKALYKEIRNNAPPGTNDEPTDMISRWIVMEGGGSIAIWLKSTTHMPVWWSPGEPPTRENQCTSV